MSSQVGAFELATLRHHSPVPLVPPMVIDPLLSEAWGLGGATTEVRVPRVMAEGELRSRPVLESFKEHSGVWSFIRLESCNLERTVCSARGRHLYWGNVLLQIINAETPELDAKARAILAAARQDARYLVSMPFKLPWKDLSGRSKAATKDCYVVVHSEAAGQVEEDSHVAEAGHVEEVLPEKVSR